jgi:hypothetical protein
VQVLYVVYAWWHNWCLYEHTVCNVSVYTAKSVILRTLPKSTFTVPSIVMPYSSQLFSVWATLAALISALLGTQPTFKQSPVANNDVYKLHVEHFVKTLYCEYVKKPSKWVGINAACMLWQYLHNTAVLHEQEGVACFHYEAVATSSTCIVTSSTTLHTSHQEILNDCNLRTAQHNEAMNTHYELVSVSALPLVHQHKYLKTIDAVYTVAEHMKVCAHISTYDVCCNRRRLLLLLSLKNIA